MRSHGDYARGGKEGVKVKYFKKVVGERIYLSPINTEDVEVYTKWLNDFDISGNLGCYSHMTSLVSEQKRLEKIALEGHDYAIILKENDELLGNVNLFEINHIARSASIGLFIGKKENRGKGYGAEALKLMLDYGFKTLNLKNVLLMVDSDNELGVACYKKVGFKEIGCRRECEYKNGRYIDIVYMDILKNEFYGIK